MVFVHNLFIHAFVLKKWDNKISPHLLGQLDELAGQTGTLQRKRGIRSALDLLKVLFLYACSDISFRILAAAACALGISDISDTAWRKHFAGAVPFLHEVLHRMLSSLFAPAGTLPQGEERVKNVLLVDASIIRQQGAAQEQNLGMPDVFGFCRYRDKTGFVRVTAQKLPKEQAEKARKRKRRKSSKSQWNLTEDTLFCAGYTAVITSLGTEYSGEEILALYRSRWQVELLFKRFKQSFSIAAAKAGSTRYAEALVLLQIIIWVIAEHQYFSCECFLKKKSENMETVYSTYENCKIALLQIKTILCLP